MQPTPEPSFVSESQVVGSYFDQPNEHEISYPAPPQNVSTAPFSVLVGLFEKLQGERKPERRRKLLHAWFNHWREEKGYDLYPVLRIILPQKDRERAVYGLKEKNLAKTYIKLIPLGPRDPDAIRLLNWKRPTEKDKSSGDFSTVLYEVVSKRSSVLESSLSIEDLNNYLDDISTNMGKSEVQSKILQLIYNRATAEEQLWVARIILKDMQIAVKETTVFAVFHPDAQDLYNTCSDLKKVAWELWNPSRRLNEEDKGAQLFRAFAPMLCKRPTRKIEDTVKEMQGKTFIIEEKLDGERVQLHKRGNEYFYCSRKGKDYTYLYGKHVGTGSLTPYIDKAFDPRVEEIILDGEMLVWDPVSERNLPFGTLKTAALDKSKKEYNPRPCFKVFDLLYLNGLSLLQKSVKTRKRNLRACLSEVPGRIELTVEYEGKTAKDVRDRMDEVMANRGEGLVIKHPEAQYVLNGRNKDWIKVKPEYMDNMGETIDVLVVSGYYGSGKRSGGVSTLVCAVLEDRVPDDEFDEPKYNTFVRIGSGLSFADYVWIRQKPWKPWDPKNPPSFLQTSKKAAADDRGDVYLEPQDSFILKVKAAEIVSSDQYHMGFTMRFPRALGIREDLTIYDCATASVVLDSIKSDKKRKMDDGPGSPKKRTKPTQKKINILPEYQGVKIKDDEIVSDLFRDMNFMVSSDPKSNKGEEDKKELIRLIRVNGGHVISMIPKQYQLPLLVIYGGTSRPYDLQLVIQKGHDVVKPQWIMDCIAQQAIVPLKKRYFFHASDNRTRSEEYNLDVDDDDELPERADTESSMDLMASKSDLSQTEPSEVDTELADWFKVENVILSNVKPEDSVTESDADSVNEDVKAEEDVVDDWLQVSGDTDESSYLEGLSLTSQPKEEKRDIIMGETEDAMDYDQDLIFRHLCFYLDSPQNAKSNGMVVKSKYEEAISTSFSVLSKLITNNGGRIVELDEPRLTHIIIDKRDSSRRLELMRRTSQPKRRHLVVADFIQACLDEGTLLDEDSFAP